MRTWSSIGYIITSVVLVVGFQNCSGVHEENSSLSSFDACNLVLKDEFSNGYHSFLQENCNGCHVGNGTGNGAFGDADLNLAFDAFNVRGFELVESRALDAKHQPPYTGPQHQAAINTLDEGWITAKAQADLCIANAGITVDNDIDEGVLPNDPQPTTHTIETFIKLINPNKDGTTLTWDLGSEIKSPDGLNFPGAQLEIEITAQSSSSGEKSYIISNPKLRAGDTDALKFQYLGIAINNQVVREANGLYGINRKVPAGEERDLIETGSMLFRYNIRSTDTISILIGNLERVAFDPPTFAELIAPGGIFGNNCMSCHDGAGNPSGGFDISTRDAVFLQGKVAAGAPNNSRIFIRMNDTQSPMPQAGMLPDADIEQVLWWIQDGAP